MKTIFALAVVLSIPTGVFADVWELYGDWTGTWYVDEKFDVNGNPSGTPPYPIETFSLHLNAYDAMNDRYGYITFGGIYPAGDVRSLSLIGSDVSLSIDYSPYASIPADPTYYAWITGTFYPGFGATIVGDFDESNPAPPGWISFRGPCELLEVPEPASLCLLGLGGLAACISRRRCR